MNRPYNRCRKLRRLGNQRKASIVAIVSHMRNRVSGTQAKHVIQTLPGGAVLLDYGPMRMVIRAFYGEI